MTPDLDKLLELAMAATPGPWGKIGDNLCLRAHVYNKHCYEDNSWLVKVGENNAAYLSALSPDVVIALVEELKALRQAAEDVLFGFNDCPEDLDRYTNNLKRALMGMPNK